MTHETHMEQGLSEPGAELAEALELLGMMFDYYENGCPCYEISGDGERGAYLGNAIELSADEENRIVAILTIQKAQEAK